MNQNDYWQTPPELFDRINAMVRHAGYLDGVQTDGATTAENPLGTAHFCYPGGPSHWVGVTYLNPPFSEARQWLERATQHHAPVVALGMTSWASNKGTIPIIQRFDIVVNLGRVNFYPDPYNMAGVKVSKARSDTSLYIWLPTGDTAELTEWVSAANREFFNHLVMGVV